MIRRWLVLSPKRSEISSIPRHPRAPRLRIPRQEHPLGQAAPGGRQTLSVLGALYPDAGSSRGRLPRIAAVPYSAPSTVLWHALCSYRSMIVAEAMTEDPVYVDVEHTVGDAVAALIKSRIRHLPVLKAGAVVGIISDHDLQSSGVPTDFLQLKADAQRLQTLLSQPVSKFMTSDAITLTPDRDLGDAIDLIIQHRIGAIPIVDPESNKLVGILSYIDALQALRSEA